MPSFGIPAHEGARLRLATGFVLSLTLFSAVMLIGLIVRGLAQGAGLHAPGRVSDIALYLLGVVSLGSIIVGILAIYARVSAPPIAERADDSVTEPNEHHADGARDGALTVPVAEEGAVEVAFTAEELAEARYDAEYEKLFAACALTTGKRFAAAAEAFATVREEHLRPELHELFYDLRQRVCNVLAALRRIPPGASARHVPSGDADTDHRGLLRCALDEPGGAEVVVEALENICDKAFDAILYGEALERLGRVRDAEAAYSRARERGQHRNELAARIAEKRMDEILRAHQPDAYAMVEEMKRQGVSMSSTVHWNRETKVLTVIPDWIPNCSTNVDDEAFFAGVAAPALRLVHAREASETAGDEPPETSGPSAPGECR